MRGKLRDKREVKRNSTKRDLREMMERRRPPKRESRVAVLLNQQQEADYTLDDEDLRPDELEK